MSIKDVFINSPPPMNLPSMKMMRWGRGGGGAVKKDSVYMSRWTEWLAWSRYFGLLGWSWYGGQIIRMLRVVRMVPHS